MVPMLWRMPAPSSGVGDILPLDVQCHIGRGSGSERTASNRCEQFNAEMNLSSPPSAMPASQSHG